MTKVGWLSRLVWRHGLMLQQFRVWYHRTTTAKHCMAPQLLEGIVVVRNEGNLLKYHAAFELATTKSTI